MASRVKVDEVPSKYDRPDESTKLVGTWIVDWNEGFAPLGGSDRIRMCLQRYAPGGGHLPHEHDDMEQVFLIVSGKGRMHLGDDEFDTSPGMVVHIPINTHHWIDNIGDTELGYYIFNARVVDPKPSSEPH